MSDSTQFQAMTALAAQLMGVPEGYCANCLEDGVISKIREANLQDDEGNVTGRAEVCDKCDYYNDLESDRPFDRLEDFGHEE